MQTSRTPKILISTVEFPPDIGGAGHVAQQYAQGLSAYCDVDVLTLHRDGRSHDHLAYTLIEAPRIPKLFALGFWHQLRDIDLDTYDVILLNDIGAVYAAGWFFGERALRKSYIFTHGTGVDSIFRQPSLLFRLGRFQHAYRRVMDKCHCIVAVSNFQKERYLDTVETGGVPRASVDDKIVVKYAGVDRDVFYPDPDPALQRRMRPAGQTALLSVSRIKEMKGYADKYRIFKRLIDQGGAFQWTVVGDGDYLSTLRRKAHRDGLASSINFEGAVQREQLRLYYSSADVFWLLSKYDEACPLVYIEASACGLPSIGRKRAGTTEAIVDGQSGFLVETNEVCERLLLSNAFEAISQEDLARHAQRFSLQRSTQEIAELITRPVPLVQ